MQAPNARSPITTTWIDIIERIARIWCRNPNIQSKRFLAFCNSLLICCCLARVDFIGGPIIGRVEDLGDMLLAAWDRLDGDGRCAEVIEVQI